jgi:hypothetical protein
VLHDPGANHKILYVNGGEQTVQQALAHALEDET